MPLIICGHEAVVRAILKAFIILPPAFIVLVLFYYHYWTKRYHYEQGFESSTEWRVFSRPRFGWGQNN